MHGRLLLPGVLLAAALAATAAPAFADETAPAPGPTQALTPSLSPPSQQQIDDAKSALDRLRNRGKATPTTTLNQVAGPVAEKGPSMTSRISDEAWWTIGAGAMVLLVLSETTRISVRRAKHRKGA